MKTKLKKHNDIRESCAIINKLFQTENFFNRLCEYSNNDIDQVINNISKIINYYLVSKDIIYTYTLEELLTVATITPKVDGILIHPTHSHYEKRCKLKGLNSTSILQDYEAIALQAVEHAVSFTTSTDISYCDTIVEDLKEAIELSFSSPSIVYKSILKQPKGKELPFVAGTDEKNYYQSVLDIRLKNIIQEERDTKAKKVKRILKGFISKDSLLAIFPQETEYYTIPKKDIEDKETGIHIPPKYLGLIKLPSRYKLLSICAQNRNIRNGELLDINTGQDYKRLLPEQQKESSVYYSRYERVSVTENFIYSNDEFTQDISYDIDLIYGSLDTNKSRERTQKDPYSNIDFLKNKNDIHVRLKNNQYHIRNGRHRLIYLKYFYVTNFKTYQEENKLDKLHELVTIPMNVERTIESPTINEYLSKIKSLDPKANIFKTNINNENPELMIIFEDKVYITTNEEELIELYNLLSQEIIYNKFYIGNNNNEHKINYEELFDYLIITLKEKLYTMDLIDIIRYLIKEGFYQKDKYYLTSNLNYYHLYFEYTDLQHQIQLNQIHNSKTTIIEETELKLLKKEIGSMIMTYIKDNPALIELEWNDLYDILKNKEPFNKFDEEFLESAASFMGYHKYKLQLFYQTERYTKKLFL